MNQIIKTTIRSLYDIQKLRIMTGNRIYAAFRIKLGLGAGEAEENNKEAHKLLDTLRAELKRVTDGVTLITGRMKIDSPLITDISEIYLLQAYEQQLDIEALHVKILQGHLKGLPLWENYLKDVSGIGPTMGGVILASIDITKCNSISALWKYAGLDVVVLYDEEGNIIAEEGRSQRKNHLVDKVYVDREGVETKTMGITFNPFLKTKLLGVLAPSFIKQSNSPYREIYLGYKHRLENHPKHKDKSKGHKHNMAVRYMIKEFLADLWTEWRTMEGLEVRPRYSEEKLGIIHSNVA